MKEALFITFLVFLLFWVAHFHLKRKHVKRLADELELMWTTAKGTAEGMIYGRWGQHQVRIFLQSGADDSAFIVVKMDLPRGFPKSLTIAQRAFVGDILNRFIAPRVVTGEDRFDEAFDVRGDADEAIQILSHEVREALLTPDYDVKKLLLRERVLTFFISKTSDTKEALGEALNAQQKLVEILVHQQFQEVREDQPASKVRQVGS